MRRHGSVRWYAAALLAMAALSPLASWWLHLAPSDGLGSAAAQLDATFSSMNPHRWWFVGWAILPFALLFAALFYASPLAFRRRWALVAAAGILVAALYCLFNYPGVGVFLLVPLVLAFWWAYGA